MKEVTMKVPVSVVLMFVGLTAYAQQGNLSNSTTPIAAEEPPVDGYYVKSDILDREVVPYSVIRPTDVAYVKRIWREFDLREKMNTLYASPKSRLIDVIMEAVMAGELTAYDPTPTEDDPTGDSFKTRLSPDQVLGRFGSDSTLVEEYDEDGNVIASHFESAAFNPDDVVRFRIKEDWIFDKQRSVFEPRIIGIAPLVTPKIDEITGGNVTPDDLGSEEAEALADIPGLDMGMDGGSISADAYPAFWIYFPEARHIFVNKEVTSRQNDATGL